MREIALARLHSGGCAQSRITPALPRAGARRRPHPGRASSNASFAAQRIPKSLSLMLRIKTMTEKINLKILPCWCCHYGETTETGRKQNWSCICRARRCECCHFCTLHCQCNEVMKREYNLHLRSFLTALSNLRKLYPQHVNQLQGLPTQEEK